MIRQSNDCFDRLLFNFRHAITPYIGNIRSIRLVSHQNLEKCLVSKSLTLIKGIDIEIYCPVAIMKKFAQLILYFHWFRNP